MSGKDVSVEIDVALGGVDERDVESVAADLSELCIWLLDEGRTSHNIVAGALLAATMLATDMVETDGPMH